MLRKWPKHLLLPSSWQALGRSKCLGHFLSISDAKQTVFILSGDKEYCDRVGDTARGNVHSKCRPRGELWEWESFKQSLSIAQYRKTPKKSTSYCSSQGLHWPLALPEYSLWSLPLVGRSKAQAFCDDGIATVLAGNMRCTFVLHSMYLPLLDLAARLFEEGTAYGTRTSVHNNCMALAAQLKTTREH